MKNKSAIIKNTSLVIVLFIIIFYAGYQVYKITYEPVKTVTALKQTIYNTVDTKIFTVRDEKYITSDVNGLALPLVNNGTRVADGDNVSVIFSDDRAAALFSREKVLEREIHYYESLSKSSSSHIFDLPLINQQIHNSVINYLKTIDSNELDKINTATEEVRNNITTRQKATGTVLDFEARLAQLRAEYQSISTSNNNQTYIKANSSGYFISYTDGYENSVIYADVLNISSKEISNLINSKPHELSDSIKGKLVENFDWYILCNLDTKQIADLKVGDTKTISLPFSPVSEFSARVCKINDTQDGKTAVVFSSREMNEQLALLRKEVAQVRMEVFEGYRVPNNAIRMLEGVKGVYILRGNLISFRKINVIYAGEDFSIVKAPEDEEGHLRLYDEIITEGKDLYAGKIID